MIDFSNGKFLEKIDICTIFGNLLDNAIEAAAKVEKVENRWIHLKTATKQSHIIIKVTNSFSGEVRKEAGQFASTKHRKGHGLGLLSIETCLKKYSGKMEIETVGDHFRVIVMIPIPESKRPVREIQ
jgi:sensor histidine kinase regulating citrate/malate metabolism